jgi:hypothetical protein
MQDFLKDRPVLSPQEVKIITPSAVSAPSAGGDSGLFARVVRGDAATAPRPAAPAPARNAAPGAAAPAHTSQVKSVVENGRITKLIVTCSCGKVTEIACTY